MCYITESAIDNEAEKQGELTCERCKEKVHVLYEIEYCMAEEANKWNGDTTEGEPEYFNKMICYTCHTVISNNPKYLTT